MTSNATPADSRKLFLLIVVIPLVFVIVGLWQLSRASAPPPHTARPSFGETIAAIEAAQREAGTPHIQVRIGNTVAAAPEVLNRLRADHPEPETYTGLRTLALALPCLELVFGLLACGIGSCGLLAIRRMGVRAAASREALLDLFSSGIRKLPWLIGATGFLIATALACGLAYETLNFAVRGLGARGGGKLLLLGIVIILALLFYALKLVYAIYKTSRAVFEPDSMTLMGKSVTRKEAPLVWGFVESIAAKAGAARPDGIILGLNECFFVTEHPVRLVSGAHAPRGRILYLPLPYMAFMTRDEAAAAIGHELGHFTGADTEYSLRFTPMYAAAVNNLRAVVFASNDDTGIMGLISRPAVLLGEFFLNSFDLAVQHWSRRREFAADRIGARVAGNEAVASSLLRVSVLAPHVSRALAECWSQGGGPQGGVVNRVRQLVAEQGFSDPMEHLEETQAHPTDSHPTMRQRLEAVNISVTRELLNKARERAESGLLKELGLETTPPETKASGQTDGNVGATLSTGSSGRPPLRAGERNGLGAALEAEFSRAARENNEEEIWHLRELAARGKEDTSYYEGGALLLAFWVLLTLVCFLAAAGLPSLRFRLGALAAGLGLAVLVGLRLKRRSRPFVTFTAQGLLFADLTQPLPWTAINDYAVIVRSFNGITTTVAIRVDLVKDLVPPAFSGDSRVKYRSKHHCLLFTVMNLRGRMNADTFSREFTIYWHGGLARHRLSTLRA